MLGTKTAILLEWPRIFAPRGIHNIFRWSCRVVLVLGILIILGAILATNLRCIPTRTLWDYTVQGAQCFDMGNLNILLNCCAILSDLIILLLPQPIIWKLRMSTQRKIHASLLFCIGLL